MSKIESLHIHNFKFFDKQPAIHLGGKHLLLYGENGSGKSSVYWALYTLFEAAIKNDDEEIKKYFRKGEEESLVNIYADKVTDDTEHYESFIEVITNDAQPKSFIVSLKEQQIRGNPEAVEINAASDFINYKILFRLQNFWHGEPIDLADIFIGDVLPYVRFASNVIIRAGVSKTITNAFAMWNEIILGPGKTTNPKGKEILVYKKSSEYKKFVAFKNKFNDEFKKLIEFININAPKMLKQLGYDIEFELSYEEAKFQKKDTTFEVEKFSIGFKITKYLGKEIEIHRPQSFLNEAKITAISLAIRLTILRQRINEEAGNILKFLVLDDLMISLDMNNRDTLTEFILSDASKLAKDYQILFLTHDRSLFYYFKDKIKNHGQKDNWVYREMYVNKQGEKEWPSIYEHPNKLKKADYFLHIHDYPACGIYLRKQCEEILNNILPDDKKYEVVQNNEGLFESQHQKLNDLIHHLQWFFQFEGLDFSEFQDLITYKSAILNTLAHNDIHSPLYREELEKIMSVLTKLQQYKREVHLERPQRDVSLRLEKEDGSFYMVGMRLKDHLYLLQIPNTPPRISRICKVVVRLIDNNGIQSDQEREEISIHKVLQDACNAFDLQNNFVLENILVDREKIPFSQKIAELVAHVS